MKNATTALRNNAYLVFTVCFLTAVGFGLWRLNLLLEPMRAAH